MGWGRSSWTVPAGKKSRAEAARGPRAEGALAAGCRWPAGPSHGSSEPALCGGWKRSLSSKASAIMVRRVQRSRISWRPGGRTFLRHGQTPRMAVLRTCGPGFTEGPNPIAVSQHIAHGLRGQKQESTVSSLAPARPSRPNHAVDWSLASEISDAARQTCPLRLSTCPSRNLRRSRSGPHGGRSRRNQL